MTTMTGAPAMQEAAGPRLSVTVKAGDLVQAVKNVAPFAGTDFTLPALCGIGLDLDAGGHLTLAATDRYALAVQVLDLAGAEHASYCGGGFCFLAADVVKVLAGIKVSRAYELITLTVADDGLTIAMPDTRVMRWPSADDFSFPKFIAHEMPAKFRPCDPGTVPGHTGYNPVILAKFAKIRDGNGSKPPRLVLTPGNAPGSAVGTMTRFECGPVTGLICQWRDAS